METPESKGGYYVTPAAMYSKLQDIDAKVNVLVERDKRDYERLVKLENTTAVIQRWVYMFAIPLMLIVSIVLGVQSLPGML